MAIAPNGEKIYLANANSDTMSVINQASNTVTATITVGADPFGVALNPNGQYAYVANLGDNSVSVISTATNTVAATVEVGSQT